MMKRDQIIKSLFDSVERSLGTNHEESETHNNKKYIKKKKSLFDSVELGYK